MEKRGLLVFMSVLFLALSFSFTSAEFSDFFKQTGQVTSEGYWTGWYDKDAPSGSGDYETLSTLTGPFGYEICEGSNEFIVDVECRVVGSKIDYSETGQKVVCSKDKGFYCKNDENSFNTFSDNKVDTCADYEVRFLCGDENTLIEEKEDSGIVEEETKIISSWNSYTCEETDVRGIDIYQKGRVTIPGSIYGFKEDICVDSNTLLEYTCSKDSSSSSPFYSEEIQCPEGYSCSDGACVKEEIEEEICRDTDGGKDIYSFGEIYVGDTKRSHDACYGSSKVIERFCSLNSMENEIISCPTGYECSGGACVKEEEEEVCEEGYYLVGFDDAIRFSMCSSEINDPTVKFVSFSVFDNLKNYIGDCTGSTRVSESGDCMFRTYYYGTQMTYGSSGEDKDLLGEETCNHLWNQLISELENGKESPLLNLSELYYFSYLESQETKINKEKIKQENTISYCVDSLDQVCSDSDGGLDYFNFGEGIEGNNHLEDFCSYDFIFGIPYLHEAYCDSQEGLSYQPIDCAKEFGDEFICVEGACVEKGENKFCYDSDGGVDDTVKGYVVDAEGIYEDVCNPYGSDYMGLDIDGKPKEYLKDYRCRNDESTYSLYVCQPDEVCLNGRCVEEEVEEEIICTDGDGGKNYLVKGTTVAPGERDSPSTDVCTDLGYLREWYCYEHYTPSSVVGKMTYETINCSEDVGLGYTCKDGACVKEEVEEKVSDCDYYAVAPSYVSMYPVCGDESENLEVEDRLTNIAIFDYKRNLVGHTYGVLRYLESESGELCVSPEYYMSPQHLTDDYYQSTGPMVESMEIPLFSKEDSQIIWSDVIESERNGQKLETIPSDLYVYELYYGQFEKETRDMYANAYCFNAIDELNFDMKKGGEDYFPSQEEIMKPDGFEEDECIGCELDGECLPLGYVIEDKYCSENLFRFAMQKEVDEPCEQNFECGSGICISKKCVSDNAWNRFLNWIVG